MSNLTEVQAWLDERVAPLLEKYDVPAAAWAVLQGDEIVDGAAGLLHKGTGVEATADSVFQIGSITKLWTSTLVMQLVDEGLVDLDQPVRTYLPDFTIADEEAAARITVRQLLTHTSGFEGDIFTDTGRGDDCVEKYLGVLHRGAPALRAGRAVLLQQRRVLRPRPAGRGAARAALRRLPARAALRAARADPLGDRALRRDHVPRGDGPHRARARRRLRAGPGVGAGPIQRPRRSDAGDAAARPGHLRQDAPRRRQGRRRHPGPRRRVRRAGCTPTRSTCRTSG